jgi:hypothetical protein
MQKLSTAAAIAVAKKLLKKRHFHTNNIKKQKFFLKSQFLIPKF